MLSIRNFLIYIHGERRSESRWTEIQIAIDVYQNIISSCFGDLEYVKAYLGALLLIAISSWKTTYQS